MVRGFRCVSGRVRRSDGTKETSVAVTPLAGVVVEEVFIEPFPFGKRFAVSLIDDTDGATLSAIDPVYGAIVGAGLRSTKTVWPLRATAQSGGHRCQPLLGDTLEDESYRTFCRELCRAGFEIAMHTASAGDSLRAETLRAYDVFEDTFGSPPSTNVMHGRNRENIYWGKYMVPQPVLSGLLSVVDDTPFAGHLESSPYFWGDICQARTRYVRLFDTLATNTLAFDPATPFHDPDKPYVNWWFSSSYGAGVRLFELLSEARLEKLAARRGASLVHFYARHYAIQESPARHRVHPAFIKFLKTLSSRRDGWYEPAVKVLDRLRVVRDVRVSSGEGQVIIENGAEEVIDDLASRLRWM